MEIFKQNLENITYPVYLFGQGKFVVRVPIGVAAVVGVSVVGVAAVEWHSMSTAELIGVLKWHSLVLVTWNIKAFSACHPLHAFYIFDLENMTLTVILKVKGREKVHFASKRSQNRKM
jgi:hypothetical protein